MTEDRLIETELFLKEFQPDIMAIQELKFNRERANLGFRFRDYNAYYKPRPVNPDFGGGTLIIIRNTIPSSELNFLDQNLDNVGIRVEINNLFQFYISICSSKYP